MASRVQALFIHDRLIATGLDSAGQFELQRDIEGRQRVQSWDSKWAHVGAYERVVTHQLDSVPELAVAVVAETVAEGSLVTLTQDFYIRRLSDQQGAFRGGLDVNRDIAVTGHFSTDRLVGVTGQSEIFGRKRFTMLAYVEKADLAGDEPSIALRPTFIGWRLAPDVPGLPSLVDDRAEVWVGEIDQFSAVRGRRVSKTDLAAVSSMSEDAVKHAFADIIGEPFVPKDWPGETSDLSTTRLTIEGDPVSAAFAFKGPGKKGKLYIADMGKRGDQAVRLAQEPVDILVVQHHSAIVAAVSKLLSALARQQGKRFMVIDGASTAILLRSYGKLAP